MASKVAALLFLGIICFHVATGKRKIHIFLNLPAFFPRKAFIFCYFCILAAQIVMDCCLSVSEKRLIPKNIVSYKLQVAGSGCDISATV